MSTHHTVICTAGHIDHGKSSLIFNLTGTHPDVLKEEQEREMTIELGFAFYSDNVTFIDVPGHEKFLKTMLAGASGVDGAILVIAADDGIMPQTREHFEILKLMGIPRGLIALTKTDLVEAGWIELVTEEIRELTKGSFLAEAPIVPVSNRRGTGMDEFKCALSELIAAVQPRPDRRLFRMWLDRAFTIKGSGTVVAGTVLSGEIGLGDKVEILPAGIIARIKRIQVHKQDVPGCSIGERAAINLPGIDKASVKRGDLLALPGHYRPTFMLNARLEIEPQVVKPVENRLRLRLHIGSSEILGRVVTLEGNPLAGGESGLVQFRLESPALADVGDRYVIRSFSEGRVLGGGVILETHPRKATRLDEAERTRLHRLETVEPREIVRQAIDRRGLSGIDAAGLAREAAFLENDIIDLLAVLRRDGEICILVGEPKWLVINLEAYNQLRAATLNYLEQEHLSKPTQAGIRKADLKSRLTPRSESELLDAVLSELKEEGLITLSGDSVRRCGFQVSFTPRQELLKNRLVELFQRRGFNPPEPEEAAVVLEVSLREIEFVINGLIELGELLRLWGPERREFYFHRDTVAEAKRILLDFFKDHKEMKFFEYRELLKSSRKFTTPLLMFFDDQGLTYREGEVRRLR